MESKVVLIDYNNFVFRSIFAWRRNKSGPSATFLCLSSIISTLKKIGCQPEDIIILAIDSIKGSWRRQHDASYKSNRREKREQCTDIDWADMFAQFKKLLEQLKTSTPFIPIELDFYEADDIIAVATRFYANKTCIIVSADTDYEQLAAQKNVKLFSPYSNKYKHIKNPIATLAKKIKKETTDNLVSPVTNEIEYVTRLKIVDLLHLPPDVERDVTFQLETIKPHQYDLSKLPFKFEGKFNDIYKEDGIVSEFPHPKRKKKPLQKPLGL